MFFTVPTSCTHVDTGEERSSSIDSADAGTKNTPIVNKRFHISKSRGLWWNYPDRGFDSLYEGGEWEATGHLKREGKRGEGTFIASAIVNGEWACTTGQVRWRTRGV